MKKYVFLILFLLMGVFVFSQPSFTVTVNPQILPPQAPFTIYVDSNSHNFSGVLIVATCGEKRLTAKSFPAQFTFYAPTLKKGQKKERTTVKVTMSIANGAETEKDVSVIVSNDAEPVITIGKASPSNNSYISKTISFPVKVYAGFGVGEIDFMVDKTIVASECEFPTKILGVYSKTYEVDMEKMKLSNGWHVFSVKVTSVTGQVYSKSVSYYVNNEPPIIKLSKISNCLAAGTCVHVNMEVQSPIGVNEVEVNGQSAEQTGKDTWNACVNTPLTTGKWTLSVKASDLAGNTSSTSTSVYVDGQRPVINLSSDAILVERNTLWKRVKPLHMEVSFLASSEKCGIRPIKSVKWGNSEGKIISTTTSVNLSTPDTYTAEATVIDPVNNKKATLSKTCAIKFDNTPPSIMGVPTLKVDYCHLHQENYVNNKGYTVVGSSSTITVEIRATDNDGVGIKNVFAPFVKATNNDNMWTFNISQLKSGENDIPLNVTLTDKLGNSAMVRSIEHIFLDGEAPNVKIDPLNAHFRNDVYWVKTKPLNVKVKSTTRSGISPTCTVEVNGVSEGKEFTINQVRAYHITVISTNVVNCKATTATKTLNVKFDDQGPKISNVKITPNSFRTKDGEIAIGPDTNLMVRIKVEDSGIGVKSVSVNDVDASLKSGVYFVKITPPKASKGYSYLLKVKAKDYLGNTSEKSTSVFIDENQPTITCTLWPDNNLRNGVYWSKKNVPFYIGVKVVTDSGVNPVVECNLNGDQFSEATLVSTSGMYNLKCIATNTVNDKSSKCSKSLKLSFDNVPPNISSVDVPATLGPNQPFKVSVSAKDSGIGVKYVEINGKLMKNNGKNTWCATLTTPSWKESKKWDSNILVVDKFGNAESTKTSVFIDAGIPTIEFYVNEMEIPNDFEGALYFKSTPTVKYMAFTDGKVEPEVDMYLDCNEKITLPLKISGVHFVKAEATDPINGKKAHFNAKFFIAVDDEPPSVDVESPQVVNSTQTNHVKITVNDSHLSYALFEMKYKDKVIYSKVYSQNENEKVVDLKRALDGINDQHVKLILTARDLAGNVSSVTRNLYVDTMPPFIQNVNFENGELAFKFNEPIFGSPYVKLIRNGKIIWEGNATISNSGDYVVAKPTVKLSFNTYEVEIKNVTDKVGNKIGNNFALWSF